MFRDIRFPTRISFGAIGGPGFSTAVITSDGGHESRNAAWEQERARYEVGHNARRPEEWRPLLAFFRVVGGRRDSWRFKDWLDYTATVSEGVFQLIDSTHFQCAKRYTFGSNWDSPADNYYDRLITKPCRTISVVGGSSPTVDYDTGIVTVSSGTPTAWYGEFDLHCRFDTDEMRHTTIDKTPDGDLIVGWQSIPIVEVRD